MVRSTILKMAVSYTHLDVYKRQQHIHHRAANPDKDTAKYILYGTLVGGPTDANGSYDDNTNSYSCTEPALDYNGCFALAIAGLYAVYGGSTTAAQGRCV